MKKLIGILVCILLVLTAAVAQDMVEGYWKSIDEDGKTTAAWYISQKDGTLQGVILKVPGEPDDLLADKCTGNYPGCPIPGDVSKMPLLGTPFIFGLRMRSPGSWDRGNIIDPKDGKMYGCRITFRAAGSAARYKEDTLEMRGTIGPFGRSQFWIRTTPTEIALLQ